MVSAKGRHTKGVQAESQARNFLRENGHPRCERITAGEGADRGDLAGVYGFTLQVKNYTDAARGIREGLAGALAQQQNTCSRWAAAIVRPHGVPDPAKWRVVMTLEQFADLTRVVRNLAGDDL